METIQCRPLGPAQAILVELQGALRGAVSSELNAVIRHLAAEGTRWMVFDFRLITSVDSQGLGALLLAARFCHDRGGRVYLLGPCKAIRSLLEVVGVEPFLAVSEDADVLKATLRRDGVTSEIGT